MIWKIVRLKQSHNNVEKKGSIIHFIMFIGLWKEKDRNLVLMNTIFSIGSDSQIKALMVVVPFQKMEVSYLEWY